MVLQHHILYDSRTVVFDDGSKELREALVRNP